MKVFTVNEVTTIKSTDNATEIELSINDQDNQRIDLKKFANISVNIGQNGTLYATETPVINANTNTLSFRMTHQLPFGTYNIEINLVNEDGTAHVAPNKGNLRLDIEKSFNEVGETIPVVSVQKLLDDMKTTLEKVTNVETLATTASTDAATAKESATSANENSNNALTKATNADTNASDALVKAKQAINDSTTALNTSDNAKTAANNAANDSATALENSNNALEKANRAETNATNALDIANGIDAKASQAQKDASAAQSISANIQEQMDNLIATDTGAEIITARTNAEGTVYDNLKARLDSSDAKSTDDLAETLKSSKDYTDSKIGGVDFSTYDNHIANNEIHTTEVEKTAWNSHIINTDVHVTTDEKAKWNNGSLKSDTLESDLAAYKEQMAASLNQKVSIVDGKGLSTNDYTTTEKTKLAGIATGANKYTLPNASATVLGGVKIGSYLDVSSGVLSATTLNNKIVSHEGDSTIHLNGGFLKLTNGSTNYLLKVDANGLYLEEQ